MLNIRWLIRLMSRMHVWVYRLTGGRLGGRVGRAPVLLLSTTGRRTGKVRTTPVLYLSDGDRLVLVASNAGDAKNPAWWTNLRSTPAATVEIGRQERPVTARLATGEEKTRLWPRLVGQYATYDAYKKRTTRDLPVVILEPRPPQ